MRSFKISVVRFLTVAITMLMFGTSTFAQVSVTLPSVSGLPGGTATGAITVGDLSGKNVTAFEFTINYNKNLYYITGATAGTLLGSNQPTVNADTANGKISVAWASASALTGSGNLVNLQFSFRSTGTQVLTAVPFIINLPGNPVVNLTDGVVTVPAVLVQGGSINAVTGDNITIPVLVSGITSAQNILSYDFSAAFNSTLISITSVDIAGTLSEGGSTAFNSPSAGNIKVAWANASKIDVASGTLLYLKGKANAVGTAKVVFSGFNLNAGSPIAAAFDAEVVITEKNVAPTLTLNPVASPYIVNEGQLLSITLVGADANAGDVSSLVYTNGTSNPVGTKVTGSTFTWTPAYNQAATIAYTCTVTVTDKGGLSATKTFTVKVNNVNRAPVFTDELPSYTTVQVVVAPNPVYYTFQYKAEDPDGENITFNLVSNLTNSSITSGGLFSWSPVPNDAGKSFVVTVEVTDGSLTTTSTQIITASSTIVGVEENEIPNSYSLLQNYPNPFNPSTSIRFGLPNESYVRLTIFNILGQEVSTLVDRQMSAGFHSVNFDASKLNTGMYVYKLEAGNFVSVKKMLFVK